MSVKNLALLIGGTIAALIAVVLLGLSVGFMVSGNGQAAPLASPTPNMSLVQNAQALLTATPKVTPAPLPTEESADPTAQKVEEQAVERIKAALAEEQPTTPVVSSDPAKEVTPAVGTPAPVQTEEPAENTAPAQTPVAFNGCSITYVPFDKVDQLPKAFREGAKNHGTMPGKYRILFLGGYFKPTENKEGGLPEGWAAVAWMKNNSWMEGMKGGNSNPVGAVQEATWIGLTTYNQDGNIFCNGIQLKLDDQNFNIIQ